MSFGSSHTRISKQKNVDRFYIHNSCLSAASPYSNTILCLLRNSSHILRFLYCVSHQHMENTRQTKCRNYCHHSGTQRILAATQYLCRYHPRGCCPQLKSKPVVF